MIKKYKHILCKYKENDDICGVECLSGKRGLCGKHYAEYIKSRSKNLYEKPKALRKIPIGIYTMSNLQVLFQKFARLSGGDFCASCGRGSNDCGGHLIAKGVSKHVALLVTNIYPQCNHCNSPQGLNGNPKGLMKEGIKFWGTEAMQELISLAKTTYSFDLGERKELHTAIHQALELLENAVSQGERDNIRVRLFNFQKSQTWYINK